MLLLLTAVVKGNSCWTTSKEHLLTGYLLQQQPTTGSATDRVTAQSVQCHVKRTRGDASLANKLKALRSLLSYLNKLMSFTDYCTLGIRQERKVPSDTRHTLPKSAIPNSADRINSGVYLLQKTFSQRNSKNNILQDARLL
jgi:hypothetical protein